MATYAENEKFKRDIWPNYPLDDAIDWIANNLSPEDVFSEEQLQEWALDHGFVEEK